MKSGSGVNPHASRSSLIFFFFIILFPQSIISFAIIYGAEIDKYTKLFLLLMHLVFEFRADSLSKSIFGDSNSSSIRPYVSHIHQLVYFGQQFRVCAFFDVFFLPEWSNLRH